MKRYTFFTDDYPVVTCDSCYEDQSENYCGPAIERLAEYEATGLMPNEVAALQYRLRYLQEKSDTRSAERLKTNADRMRSMMDEELAAFQARRNVSEACMRLKDQGYVPTEEQKEDLFNRLYGTWLKWLRQPAEEDHHAD